MGVPAPGAKVAPPTAWPDVFPPDSEFALTADGEPLSKTGTTWLIWDWSNVPPTRGKPSDFMVSKMLSEADFRAAVEALHIAGFRKDAAASLTGGGTLEHAIERAARAHAGQVDKAGAPYVSAATPLTREEASKQALTLSPEAMDWAIEQRTVQELEQGKNFGTGKTSSR